MLQIKLLFQLCIRQWLFTSMMPETFKTLKVFFNCVNFCNQTDIEQITIKCYQVLSFCLDDAWVTGYLARAANVSHTDIFNMFTLRLEGGQVVHIFGG